MLIDRNILETVSEYTGLAPTRLQNMYDGMNGPYDQLLAHALCSVPVSFYEGLKVGMVNAACERLGCMNEEKMKEYFGADLMRRLKRANKYRNVFTALENMTLLHVDNCVIALTAMRNRRELFVSMATPMSDIMKKLEEEADDDGESGNV